MTLKAKCLKVCPFKYGSCNKGLVYVHPRYKNRTDLIRNEEGYLLCYNGRMLTVFDRICDNCGTELEFEKDSSNVDYAVYTCPECKKKITMDVVI